MMEFQVFESSLKINDITYAIEVAVREKASTASKYRPNTFIEALLTLSYRFKAGNVGWWLLELILLQEIIHKACHGVREYQEGGPFRELCVINSSIWDACLTLNTPSPQRTTAGSRCWDVTNHTVVASN